MFLQLSPVPKATHPQQSWTCGVNTKSSLKTRAFPSLTPETISFTSRKSSEQGPKHEMSLIKGGGEVIGGLPHIQISDTPGTRY